MTTANSLESISIVLVKTSHPGNVGSVARAMKTMGLSDLRLVRPRSADICKAEEAIALASGAVDVLEGAKIFDNLPQALEDRSVAFALSARLRDLGPALQSPAEAARETRLLAQRGVGAAFVFGAERTGLTNEEVLVCNRQVLIPANPAYSSLNLSQAVQIVAYALRLEFEGEVSGLAPEKHSLAGQLGASEATASIKAVADLQAHWLQAMEAVDFVNPEKPRKVVQRLARMLAKIPLEQEEVDMLRGFLSDVVRVADNRLYPHEIARKKP